MKANNILLIWFTIFFIISSKVNAQDAIPNQAVANKSLHNLKPMSGLVAKPRIEISDSIPILPNSFKGVKPNVIVDKSESLKNFFKSIRLSTVGIRSNNTRVLQIGDSHIKGGFFTDEVKRNLEEVLPFITYEEYGINGATASSFNKEVNIHKIKSFKPDLLILSFGTNESHSLKYNQLMHKRELDDLIRSIRVVLPQVPIILTTPPGSFDRKYRNIYTPNPRTADAAKLIKDYANDNKMAYWDLYNIAGGVKHANTNWDSAELMRPDHVHYIAKGYELQGQLFFEALIKAYNEYNTL